MYFVDVYDKFGKLVIFFLEKFGKSPNFLYEPCIQTDSSEYFTPLAFSAITLSFGWQDGICPIKKPIPVIHKGFIFRDPANLK